MKGFHPEHACMKKKLNEATSLLDKNHINLLEIFQRIDQQDREPQHERGDALMASTSKSKALLIDSGASNHMMDERDSFSSLDTSKSIPIHMEMTPPSFQKDKVQLILRMTIFQMFCMYRLWHQISLVSIR